MLTQKQFKTQVFILIQLFLIFASNIFADIPRTMYLVNGSAETISKLNLENQAIQSNIITTNQIPNQILAHHNLLYVVNSGTDDIQVIDPRNDSQIKKTIALPTGNNPWYMAFVGSKKAYVTNWIANTVSVINVETGELITEIEVGTAPQGILVVGNKAFIANTGYGGWNQPYHQATISIIDTEADSAIQTLDVPTNAQDFALAPDGKIHVICTGNYVNTFGQIAVIDLYTGPMWDKPAVVDTIEIGGSPGDIIITPDGKGYCVAWGDGVHGFLYSYDVFANTVIHDSADPILIGPNVSQMFFDNRENVIWIPYMTEWGGDGFVQKFDPQQDSVLWVSGVVGNGTQALTIQEPILDSTPGADKVVSFTPGQNAGFGNNFFPENVLGMPDPSVGISAFNPSTKPQEILGLGHGGEIVLTFTDNYIVNGEGVDFTVFENVFYFMGTTDPFIEAAIVSVSQDGANWYTFPYDTSTYAGFAGVTPTKDNQHPTDPAVSGGDQFDLTDVNLEYASFVKLTDIGDLKQEGLWNDHFDLDAVVAVNSAKGRPTAVGQLRHVPSSGITLHQNYPNPFNLDTKIKFRLETKSNVRLQIYNLNGQLIRTLSNQTFNPGNHEIAWNSTDEAGQIVASGIYFYKIQVGSFQDTKQLILLE